MIDVDIQDATHIILELDQGNSPETVKQLMDSVPFTVTLNVWGDEVYTSESPVDVPEENAKSSVSLSDVAYWPAGKAICMFFGPTPIGKKGEITPASPVNVIGKIISPDKSILNIVDGRTATFRLKS